MESAAYLYSLFDNERVIRRDLPSRSPAENLAPVAAEEEFDALESRGRLGLRKLKLLDALRPPKPQQPKLVSSSEGEIAAILLTVPQGRTSGDYQAIFNELLETLPRRTRFVCLVNRSSRADVEQWLKIHKRDATATIVEAEDELNFSIWAQDAYAVCTSADISYFIEPLSFLRYADALIADYVVETTDLKDFQVPLYFQGGNILIGDDFWLIGVDYPMNTLDYVGEAIFASAGEKPEELVERLFTENLDVYRKLLYVGSTVPVPSEDVVLVQEGAKYFVDMVYQANRPGTAQPMFHIDMFLTLAGRNQDNKYRILVGDPSLAPQPSTSSLGAAYSMQHVYDTIAVSLTEAGFEVIRNPLPLTFETSSINVEQLNRSQDTKLFEIYKKLDTNGVDNVDLRSWYFATANNALVEITPHTKRVWVPTYGHEDYAYLKASDDLNKEIWESLGFQVTMLPSFHNLARGLGAVHCIQKYLERS